jgi:hypothetical protein
MMVEVPVPHSHNPRTAPGAVMNHPVEKIVGQIAGDDPDKQDVRRQRGEKKVEDHE